MHCSRIKKLEACSAFAEPLLPKQQGTTRRAQEDNARRHRVLLLCLVLAARMSAEKCIRRRLAEPPRKPRRRGGKIAIGVVRASSHRRCHLELHEARSAAAKSQQGSCGRAPIAGRARKSCRASLHRRPSEPLLGQISPLIRGDSRPNPSDLRGFKAKSTSA